MSDKIELTEEQARELYAIANCYYAEEFYSVLKEKGYIKQSPVEKAEEIIGEYLETKYTGGPLVFRKSDTHYDIFKEAINYLKKQLEEK